jgi:tRNA(Ile)-lysidine synthase
MSAPLPNLPARAPAEHPFLTALAAALPLSGLGRFPIVVAVSGGADSVALLVGLAHLGVSRLVVAHAEHDLRDEAPADREFVGRLAERLGLPFVWRHIGVRARDDAGGEGLEARARRMRYGFLVDVARECAARHVLVAHTADDQAETILHRILRGTGIAGLAGMQRARELCDGVSLLRPLLDFSRADGRVFLSNAGEVWREDASNTDTARARNFLRHDVLPRCVNGPYPAAVASVTRLGGQAATVAAALASAAEHLLDLYGSRQPDGTVILRTRAFAGLDPHLLAEVFVALWRREGWPQRDMTAGHYEMLTDMILRAEDYLSRDLPGGITARTVAVGMISLGPLESGVSAPREPDSHPGYGTSRS